jgi:DNA-binding winged helix-turn-helix (wHTH) protein
MNSFFAPFTTPFTRSKFWGRQKELSIIWGRLLSKPPQSVVVIGEPYMGKTRLVKQLIESPVIDEMGYRYDFTYIYLDCKSYTELVEDWQPKTQVDGEQSNEYNQRDMSNFAAARFWWDLYTILPRTSQAEEAFSEPLRTNNDDVLLDVTYEISLAIEKWLRCHNKPIIFILDNFEGVAHLPLRNSHRLRSLANYCAFVLTSRYALYVLYNFHPESWGQPSPFYNIFSDTIYLGLLSEQEMSRYLEWAAEEAEKAGSHWNAQDIAFIRKMAGHHPELLRIACARMFEESWLSQSSSETGVYEQDHQFLALRLVQEGATICKRLWEGLTNPELYGLVRSPGIPRKEDSHVLSPYQLTLIEIAHGRIASDTNILFELEQRGLILHADDKWRIFSEIMQQFVLMQEETIDQDKTDKSVVAATSTSDILVERDEERSLTYMEGKVYDYLKAHLDEVCDRAEIMRAVWREDNMRSSSALQKIIERIREKIEDDPDSPFRLIAVRGRGYMLRRIP